MTIFRRSNQSTTRQKSRLSESNCSRDYAEKYGPIHITYPNIKKIETNLFQTYVQIKLRNSISFGATHLLFELRCVRMHCTTNEQQILFDVLQNNAYFAHPEAVLLSMLGNFISEYCSGNDIKSRF